MTLCCGQTVAREPTPVEITVQEVSPLPDPRTVPYADCLRAVLATRERGGAGRPEEVIVLFDGFVGRQLYPGASLKPGDEVSVELAPFEDAPRAVKNRMQANSLDNFTAPMFVVSAWDVQDEFVQQIALRHGEADPATTDSNRDIIVRILRSHGGAVTGGRIDDFFFWTHVPDIYRDNFWTEIRPTKKNAIGAFEAVRRFHQALAARGIQLLFVPVPRSPAIYPGLATNMEYDPDIDGRVNDAVGDFIEALEREGIACVDLTPEFLATRWVEFEGDDYPLYRKNDSHWGPLAVRIAARLVAERVRAMEAFGQLGSRRPGAALVETPSVEEFRYLMPVLEGREPRRRPPEDQVVYRVTAESEADRDLLRDQIDNAEIHLLGDSFVYVYGSGHGGGGIHPHLVKELATPINRLATASGGPTISRNQFARTADLDRAKIVVWMLADTFLAAPDIWGDVPVERSSILDLETVLAQAERSSPSIALGRMGRLDFGSSIVLGDRDRPGDIPLETHCTWDGVRIGPASARPSLHAYPVVKPVRGGGSTAPAGYLFEVEVNGESVATRQVTPGRLPHRDPRLKVALDAWAGEVVELTLRCRIDPSGGAPSGIPAWMVPQIDGATFASAAAAGSPAPVPEGAAGRHSTTGNSTPTLPPTSGKHPAIWGAAAALAFALFIGIATALRRASARRG